MKDFLEFLKNLTQIRKIYTSFWFLFVIPFLGFYISEKFNFITKTLNFEIDQKYFVLEFSLVCVGLYVGWWSLQQPPKIKRGKLGIGIAINAESDEEKKRLKNDFINEIKKQTSLENSELFQVLILPEFFVEKINDQNSAMKYQRATHAHFFIYGSWKTRMDEGKETYILNLEALVVHSPINQVTSNIFSREMSALFPRDVKIPKELELTEIPFTGDMVSFAVKHCIGIASSISGDIELAFKLHRDLWKQIKEVSISKSTYFYCVNLMRQNLPKYLYQEAIFLNDFYYDKKPSNYLGKMKEFLDVMFSFYPKDYFALVRLGIYQFEKGEIEEAIKTTQKAIGLSGNRDTVAYYNLAFLLAYQGRLEDAHKAYKHGFSGTVRASKIILNIEEFIEGALAKNSDMVQFYYCLGMINYFGKEDMILARENFEKFISLSKQSTKFSSSVKYARKYLNEISVSEKSSV